MKNNKNRALNTSGLTLVELLVVITILAILGTIAFMSLGGYSANARDSARVSDIGSVSKTLEAYVLQTGNYPVPTSPFPLTYSGSPVFLQGTLGDSVITNLSSSNAKITKKPIDPLTGKEYAYSALAFGRGYQIKADYEGESIAFSFDYGSYSCIASYSSFSPFLSSNISFITSVQAANGNPALSFVKGNYNGLVAKTETGGITYVLTIPSLITNATGTGDVSTLSGKFLFHRESNTVGLSFTPSVVFSGTTLPKDDSTGQITALVNAIKLSYTGTQIVEKNANTNASDINSILATTDSNKIALIGSAIIKNYLGGKTSIGEGTGGGGSSFTCTGTAPVQVTGMTISTTAPTNNTTAWTYSGSTNVAGPACTWKCDTGYVQSSATCLAQLYADDVFSTFLYTGNGGTQTISNGIDLATNGGMVWIKGRNLAGNNFLFDTTRGAYGILYSDQTNTSGAGSQGVSSFNSDGFTVTQNGTVRGTNGYNGAFGTYLNDTHTSWTFRKAPKFFDVVTWTGNAISERQISHNLGISPGMIIIKKTGPSDSGDNWQVYNRSLGATKALYLNTADGSATNPAFWNNVEPTSTHFTIGNSQYANQNNSTYVAYLFAHDTSTDGIIQAGSYTGNGTSVDVELGWEPQYLLVKRTDGAQDWMVIDNMRDWNGQFLRPNTSGAEDNGNTNGTTRATGFTAKGNLVQNTGNYVYLAIRRPNKPPTNGMQVFQAVQYSGTSTSGKTVTYSDLPYIDLIINSPLNTGSSTNNYKWWADRLRSPIARDTTTIPLGNWLCSTNTSTESSSQVASFLNMNQLVIGETNALWNNGQFISYALRRASGVFDIVAYTGNGIGGRTIAHNLSVAPEMIIVRPRNRSATNWSVLHKGLSVTSGEYLTLNTGDAKGVSNGEFHNTLPSANNFTVGINWGTNGDTSTTYIAYLFASKAGVSKVGSYTGNGSSQVINANFTSSARFILIKRTDVVGDWYVWDSVRGIVTANDPHFSLNSAGPETVSDDSIDPDNTGFIVNQNNTTDININEATYIYLAFQ